MGENRSIINNMRYIDNQSGKESSSKGRKRGSRNLQAWQREVLEQYLQNNSYDLYPSEIEKLKLAREINSTKKKISNWFINTRKLQSKPGVVKMNKMRYKPQIQLKKRLQKEQEKYQLYQLQYGLDELRMTQNQPLVNISGYCLGHILENSCPGSKPKDAKKQFTPAPNISALPQSIPLIWTYEAPQLFPSFHQWE